MDGNFPCRFWLKCRCAEISAQRVCRYIRRNGWIFSSRDLNPTEVTWAQVKSHVRHHNKTGYMSVVQELVKAAVEQVTQSHWASCCDHVIKAEEMYWKSDRIMEEIEPFVIGLVSDDESDTDSDDDSDV